MNGHKTEFLCSFFEQIESQVQFGDNKASLLVAGDAILLAITGAVMKMASGCQKDEFSIECIRFSWTLLSATMAALFLLVSLACALWAALPSRIHGKPPPEFFLFSHVGRLDFDSFVESYNAESFDLEKEALATIYGKAKYAIRKFRWLRRAVYATLFNLLFLLMTILAVTVRVLQSAYVSR